MSNGFIFMHGGASVVSNGYATSTVLNDLTKLDSSAYSWKPLANGPAMMYHTMCKLTGLNVMVIFGGIDQANKASNVVHVFDLTIEAWRLAEPVGTGIGGSVPSARRGHTAICLDNTMIVYGGGPEGPLDDDVWIMNASQPKWVWDRMTTNKAMGPGARTGHSALLNGTNMIVWGGYGSAVANDTQVYSLDTLTWQWSSIKEPESNTPPIPVGPPNEGGADNKGSNMPITIGVICGGLALALTIVGFLIFRRRSSRRKKDLSQGTSSFLSDPEQQFSKDVIVEDKPSLHSLDKESASSSGGRRSPIAAPKRRSPQEYPMQSMTALAAVDQESNRGESSRGASSRSSGQYLNTTNLSQKEKGPISTAGSVGARVGSISSDPFYPPYLAEDDEEDADRWTFASSLSFDHRDNNTSMPTLRYIPTRVHGASPTLRSLGHSTGSLGGSSTQRVPMMVHPPAGGTRSSRREPSGMSIRTGNNSSNEPGSITLAPPTSTDLLRRESSTNPRETTLFNSVSPLDRVTLMCSGMDVSRRPSEEDPLTMTSRNSEDTQLYGRGVADLRRKDTTSTSTTKSSTTYTTLDNPALVALVQNLPARYKVSRTPSPIHGETNDILFAIDSDTQQPIVIKSFARKEAWERECRILRRLRGPCVVELKHVATLVVSETDDPTKPAKIRLTILERLDETLAQMLKNARKAKKVALREQSPSNAALDLTGPGLYQSGPSLDEGYIKDIVKGVLRCLAWCHSKRIVYCDLKPSNVMHNRDDPRQQWKLIDLESSRVASEECIGIGTVRYCPPEVARGTTVDKQASSGVTANYSIDLWAFGCLLYELFATRPLFPLSLSDDTVLHFLAHPSSDTPALANGLRWSSSRELEIPHFEQAVPDPSARALIRMLLHPDPQRRANLNNVLASDYLCINPETEASTSSDGRYPIGPGPRSPQLIQQTRFQSAPQEQGLSGWTVQCVTKSNPCLVVPLPNLGESSWLDPSTWTTSSFKLHYLCQHNNSQGPSSEPSLGHYVQQPGYPISNPQSLFKDLSPLLLMSLDLQLSRSEQTLPGFEALSAFEYSPDKDQAILNKQDSSEAGVVAPGVVRGFAGYLQWMRRRVQQLTSTASPTSSTFDERQEIAGSLQALQAYSETVNGPNSSSHGVPAGLQLISRGGGTNQRQETLLVCDGHVHLPQYNEWTIKK
ncbi:hypothetical protein BGX34_007949 [Mortierella sp. NVP85]|nr:hypothetical protein BGX34_007949 [Mortierella sp. NVP85]